MIFDKDEFCKDIDGMGYGYAIICSNEEQVRQAYNHLKDIFPLDIWSPYNDPLDEFIQSCYDEYGDTFFNENTDEYVGFYFDTTMKKVSLGMCICLEDADVGCVDVEWTPEVIKVDPNMLAAFL